MPILRIAVVAALVLVVAGCAGAPATVQTPEDRVAQRAQARWDHLLQGRWDDAYGYFTPGYREANSLETFQRSMLGRRIRWASAQLQGVECESAERCIASVEIDFELIGGMPGVPQVESSRLSPEVWLRLDGEWYFLPQRQLR